MQSARKPPGAPSDQAVDPLLASLTEFEDAEIEQAWADEAERRLADMRSGKTQGIPSEVVMAEAWARVRACR